MDGQTKGAQWIEIVRVRLADTADAGKVQRLFGELSGGTVDDAPPSFTAVLYKNTFVQTDWSIHLIWLNKKSESGSSPLATYLSRSLQALGIVNHSSWETY